MGVCELDHVIGAWYSPKRCLPDSAVGRIIPSSSHRRASMIAVAKLNDGIIHPRTDAHFSPLCFRGRLANTSLRFSHTLSPIALLNRKRPGLLAC